MKLKIREMSWFKRRAPTVEPKPVKFEISNVQLIQNHMCDALIMYDDNRSYAMEGRVCQNDITGKWLIHCINPYGKSVILDVVEE